MKCPDDYNVIMTPGLAGDVLAVVRVDEGGYPTVYINDALSTPAKRMALAHELWHFKNGDMYNHVTIYDAEKKACFAARLSQFNRSFRVLTEPELLRLDVSAAALFLHAFGDPVFDLPLDMPEPMYDTEPPPPIHGIIWDGW